VIAKSFGGGSVPVSRALAFAVADEAWAVVSVVTFELDPGIVDTLLVHRNVRRDTEMSMIIMVIVSIAHCLCFENGGLFGTVECDIYRDLWIKHTQEAVARVPDEDRECLVRIAVAEQQSYVGGRTI
jgi:hypothetical protein